MHTQPEVISADQANSSEHPFPWDFYERRCLAQGDSWFSIGAIPPTQTTRVIAELRLTRSTVIVNCARPREVLRLMADTTSHVDFIRLLSGTIALRWDAILLSGGGNDLIAAAKSPPSSELPLRLLRTPSERGSQVTSAADYISEPGWKTFENHIRQVFALVIEARDSGVNSGVPLVWHNYARVMPTRVSGGAGGPWLRPSLVNYGVPPSDFLAVSDELTGRLADLIDDIATSTPGGTVHVADSRSAGLVLADPDADGESGDWHNEIHPTKEGYRKCGAVWAAKLNPILG